MAGFNMYVQLALHGGINAQSAARLRGETAHCGKLAA